jgi:hypothetical protein
MARILSLTVHSGDSRPLPGGWRELLDLLPEDLRDLYEERAALIEYDGGEKRATAERRAFECVLREAAAAGLPKSFWGKSFWGSSQGQAGESRAAVN